MRERMRITKKLLLVWMLSLPLLMTAIFFKAATVSAVTLGDVYDDANLLTNAERESLNEQITALKEKTGWDIFAVTTDNANGKTTMAYADDFYDEKTSEDSNGFLVLIDMDNREIYISTSGKAIRYLTDSRIEAVLDAGYNFVSNGIYEACLSAMISKVDEYYEAGIPEDQYNYDVETGAISKYRTVTWMEAWPIAILAIGVGFGIYFGVQRSYSIKGGKYEYPFQKYGEVKLRVKEDQFLHKSVTHHRIQTSSSGSSSSHSSSHRSSTHRSSSGRSHGGGGRKF